MTGKPLIKVSHFRLTEKPPQQKRRFEVLFELAGRSTSGQGTLQSITPVSPDAYG